jgi:hypothetical protein
MNHNTQQAIGNILTCLWLGAKVYMNEKNTAFQYFKRIGLNIYSLQADFKADCCNQIKGLNDFEIEINRKILMEYHSENAVLMQVRNLLSLI